MNSEHNKKVDQLRPSSYDGIQEFDNDLPRWWVWIFYLTGIYGVFYVVGLYGFNATIPPLPNDPSGGVVAVATPTPASQDDEMATLKTVVADASRVAKGQEVYVARCAACHGQLGGGLVGPNLTDEFWIHGGKLTDIESVIENGVLDKGMLAWKSMLSKDDIRSLVAYIHSIKGTNPAGAKEAQGEKYAE